MAPHLQSLLSTMSEYPDAHQEREWIPEEMPVPGLCRPRPQSDGHYSSPGLEKLRWALAHYHLETLELLSQETQGRLDLLQLSLEQGLDRSDDPLYRQIQAATLQFQMALKMAILYVETQQSRWSQSALELAQAATDQMAGGYLAFIDHAQACLTVYCPRCSGANPRGQQRCSHCAQGLPQPVCQDANAEPQQTESQTTTPNHDRVVAAVEGFRQGLMTASVLRQEVTEVWQNLHRHWRSLDKDRQQSRRLPAQQAAAYSQVLEAIEAALDSSLAAVEELLSFFEDQQPVHLEQGMDLLSLATPQMVDAFRDLQNLGTNAE